MSTRLFNAVKTARCAVILSIALVVEKSLGRSATSGIIKAANSVRKALGRGDVFELCPKIRERYS